MPGEEEERLGSAAQLLTIIASPSGKENQSRTNHESGGPSVGSQSSGSSRAYGLPKPHPPPTALHSSHHADIEETKTPSPSESGGSKGELELQFAGVDNETVELEEVECNYGSGVFGSSPGEGGPTLAEVLEDKESKPPDPPPPLVPETLVQKCLFYTTAFFILLAVFSLFLFLFLVPFVIDPAFTTIFNEFDPEPAFCRTEGVVNLTGAQCTKSWTSCREGCTKEVYNCTQIWVRYRAATPLPTPPPPTPTQLSLKQKHSGSGNSPNYYNYNHDRNEPSYVHKKKKHKGTSGEVGRGVTTSSPASPAPPPSDGWFRKAHLFPNVKGCGYPPSLNCSIFLSKYAEEGRNFSCFYSKVKPWLVVTSFNMNHVILELALSMAIPIPCFLISVIYLVFAYFKIYNTSSTPPSSSGGPRGDPTTNNNGPSPSPEPPQTSLSTLDEKTKALRRSSSRTLNALADKLLPNSKAHPPMEMNDLTPIIRHTPQDNSIRNNRAPERNGPTNPPAKNKGGLDVGYVNGETSFVAGERFLDVDVKEPNAFPTNEIPERKPLPHVEEESHNPNGVGGGGR